LDRISEIRQRKIAQYRQLLPANFDFGPVAGDMSDLAYAACLARIASVAPADFALRAGASRRLSDLGLLGHLIMSCSRLDETYEIWMQHAQMAGELVQLDSRVVDDQWRLEFVPLPFLPRQVAAFCCEEMCAVFFAFMREITCIDFADFTVALGHERKAHVDYATFFPCPVRFNNRRTQIFAPASARELPQISRDPETFEHLLRHFRSQNSQLERFATRPISLKLYDHFIRNLGTGPSLEQAARAIGTSQRSLVRHLHAEETSFGEVLEAFRRAYAAEFLRDTMASPKQIAHALGYHSENSLRRAFRHWTGKPIGAWRKAERSAAGESSPPSQS
jgi:AraC-like DNA-binding protein